MIGNDEDTVPQHVLVRAQAFATRELPVTGDVALLLRDDHITQIGSFEHLRPQVDEFGADVIDLGGRTLLPGLIDGHNHQPSAARDRFEVLTAHVSSLEALFQVITSSAAERPLGSWIVTERNLTRAQLREARYPTVDELSAAVPDHPVSVRFGAHSMVLNHAACEAVGLDDSTTEVRGGHVERYPDGRPMGPIHEYGVTRLVSDLQPVVDPDALMSALVDVQASYLRSGITTVRIPGVRPGELSWYQQLRNEGRLRNRALSSVRVDPNLDQGAKRAFIDGWEVATGFGDHILALDALKFFVDGGVGSSDAPATRFLDASELEEIALYGAERGWAITCHAVSSAAIEDVLVAFAQIRLQVGRRARLAIEHAFFATEEQVARCARLGIWLSLQPSLVHLNSHLLDVRAGPAVTIDAVAAHRVGANVALGSDWNATPGTMARPYAPFQTLSHVMASGELPLAAAIDLHTAAVGRLAGRPDIGRLAPGCVADLVAVPGSPRDLAEQLQAGEVPRPSEVIFGGELVVDQGQLRNPVTTRQSGDAEG